MKRLAARIGLILPKAIGGFFAASRTMGENLIRGESRITRVLYNLGRRFRVFLQSVLGAGPDYQ
jgi:hypothetical protein